MAWIDANTKLNPQEYKMAGNRDAITDGLSEEAIGYVNQAVGRTEENNYSIFDKETGLMPDSFSVFDEMADAALSATDNEGVAMSFQHYNGGPIGQHIVINESGEGTLSTSDGQLQFQRAEDGSWTVSYDSDGQNGFDRTATYQNFEGIGWQKIQETFDADGNGTNEVDINKNIDVKSDSYWKGGPKESTEDKSFWDKAKDWWNGLWGKETKEEYSPRVKVDSHYVSSEVNIGVNADNIGAHHEEDGKIVHHYEYYESNVKNPNADAYYDYSEQGKDRDRMPGEDYLSETYLREESLNKGRTITQEYHEWQSSTQPTANDKHNVKTFEY